VFDGDRGPNTGGMGAFAPVPWVDSSLCDRIRNLILEPSFRGLREDGIPYCGILYAGLMIGSDGMPRVIEYNVRFGDPEAQVVIPLLEGDFGEMIIACCEGRLGEVLSGNPPGGLQTWFSPQEDIQDHSKRVKKLRASTKPPV